MRAGRAGPGQQADHARTGVLGEHGERLPAARDGEAGGEVGGGAGGAVQEGVILGPADCRLSHDLPRNPEQLVIRANTRHSTVYGFP